MKMSVFPLVAMLIGGFIQLVLLMTVSGGGETAVPMLTLLLMTEFGFIVSAIGAFLGIKRIIAKEHDLKLALPTLACIVISILLAIEGADLWAFVNAAN